MVQKLCDSRSRYKLVAIYFLYALKAVKRHLSGSL